MWLRREMASVILDFKSRADAWQHLGNSSHAEIHPGYKSYTMRQRDAWRRMHQDALERCYAIISVS